MSNAIGSLAAPESYRETRSHVFRSKQSLQWFLRQHRQVLVDCGALVIIAGRQMLDPAKTDAALLLIGQKSATKNPSRVGLS